MKKPILARPSAVIDRIAYRRVASSTLLRGLMCSRRRRQLPRAISLIQAALDAASAHAGLALDEALAETFPASDPAAVAIR